LEKTWEHPALTLTNANSNSQSRLRGFAIHLSIYFGLMIIIVPLNYWLTPENTWFVLPLVGWGSVLSLHVAYVMGLFGKPDENKNKDNTDV